MASRAAALLKPDAAGIARAAKMLRDGQCVAFPTETVYGLGANALSEESVLKIFEYKGRPLTDPLIVHVAEPDKALDLVELQDGAREAFRALTEAFWPGPLTLVSKARSVIPGKVTADTGFVGIRCPAHALARQLISEAGVPIAAPSANRFGHVSPTKAAHVMADLGDHPIGIVDGEAGVEASEHKDESGSGSAGTCAVGIESTVAKIDSDAGELIVFRRGGVSIAAIQRVLADKGITMPVRIVAKAALVGDKSSEGLEAPGQLLTHYAPDVETYLVHGTPTASADSGEAKAEAEAGTGAGAGVTGATEARAALGECVVLDFGGALASLKALSLAYRDLSAEGNMHEARKGVFDALRWAELVEGARAVLLADPKGDEHEDAAAVRDRLFRAASGRFVSVDTGTKLARQVTLAPEDAGP